MQGVGGEGLSFARTSGAYSTPLETMKKRRTIWICVGLALAVAAVVIVPTSRVFLVGWLRREATYQGKPTNFWISALRKDPFLGYMAPQDDAIKLLAEGGSDSVPVLSDILREKDWQTREKALRALVEMGAQAKAAVPAVAEKIRTEANENLLQREVDILVRLDLNAAVPALFWVWKEHPSARSRNRALSIVTGFGPKSKEAAPALTEILKDSDPHIRVVAAATLWQINEQAAPLLPTLLDGAKSDNTEVRALALHTLCVIGPEEIGPATKEVMPSIVEGLEAKDAEVRSKGVSALGKIAPEQTSAPRLIAALKDEAPVVRSNAAYFLGRIGAKEAVPALIAALKDETADVRHSAAFSLSMMPGKSGQAAVQPLVVALKDKATNVRAAAAMALRRTAAKEAIAPLLVALKDKEAYVRQSAVFGLGGIGSEELVPPLAAALRRERDDVRLRIVWTLGEMGPAAKGAVPALVEALKDEKSRIHVVRALGDIGPEAKSAVPALTIALKDKDPEVRVYAAFSLWRIDPQTGVTLPFLRQALEDGNASAAKADVTRRHRAAAAYALCRIDPKTGIPALCKIIENKTDPERASVIGLAAALGPAAKAAVPALQGALKADDPDVRRAAAQTLGIVGREMPSVVAALLEAAKDSDLEVRRAAADAVKAINSRPSDR